MTTLSAILITRDEAHDIAACLACLGFCDEIVVVDGGSRDGTAAIARAAGARVTLQPDWPGFGPQKQRALALATGDWVLSVDADERIPPALAAEIRAAITDPGVDGYRLNRLTSFLGRPLRHGGWFPDRILRLARRRAARFTDDVVHEQLTVEGRVRDLAGTMGHLSYTSIAEVLDKQRRYALAGAARRRRARPGGGLAPALFHSLTAFLRGYLLFAGFLDGAPGCVAALARAQETFWRHLAIGWERADGAAAAPRQTHTVQTDTTKG